MKILWIVNIIFPFPATKIGQLPTAFGGWLSSLAIELRKDKNIELAIATSYYGKKILEFDDGKVKYYLVPGAPAIKYNKKYNRYWLKVNKEFRPDLVHIHGTEYAHGLNYIDACPNEKVIISIQGLLNRISDVYLANISFSEIIKNITIRDCLRFNNLFQAKKKYKLRSEYEKEIIQKSMYVIGRTFWDYSNVRAINNDIKYFKINETLRENFYLKRWNIKNIDKHTLFCSQAEYPIKSLHYLLEAVKILKTTYNDIKLYISGSDITDVSTFKSKLKLSGYGNYIKKLINKYKLNNNIIFTGILDEGEIIKRLLKTHVFVLPSAIENSSNSLAEAMLLRDALCCF